MASLNVSAPLLNAFVTLAHCRQFTLAAQRCNMSQSAFSQAIARLESEVGARLFDRNTRSVSLTPEGDVLLPVAQRVLEDLQTAIGDLRDHANRRKGMVAVAALPSLAAEWVPAVLAEFHARYPGIAVNLFDVVFERTLALVREGTVDFVISALAGLDEEFDTRVIFADRFFLVCRPEHALASRRSVRLSALAGQTYIHTTRTGSMWRSLYPHLREVPLRDAGFEVSYLSTLAGMIANGWGVSVVTGVSLFHFTRLGLAAIPISDDGLHYDVGIAQRRGRSLSIAARALADLLNERLPAVRAGSQRSTLVGRRLQRGARVTRQS